MTVQRLMEIAFGHSGQLLYSGVRGRSGLCHCFLSFWIAPWRYMPDSTLSRRSAALRRLNAPY